MDVHLHKTGRRSHFYGQIAQLMAEVSKAISSMKEAEPGRNLSSKFQDRKYSYLAASGLYCDTSLRRTSQGVFYDDSHTK